MEIKRFVGMCALALSVSGCMSTDGVTRNAVPGDQFLGTAAEAQQQYTRDYRVRDVRVNVPESLVVSEENSYYPIADIVWRGEAHGDRYQQDGAIFETGFERGTSGLRGSMPVVVNIEVERFHSLTERTRYSIGGNHSIRFRLSVTHAVTGAVVEPERVIQADLDAFGGQQAIEAERAGQGQKVRILDHLAQVALRELSPVAGS